MGIDLITQSNWLLSLLSVSRGRKNIFLFFSFASQKRCLKVERFFFSVLCASFYLKTVRKAKVISAVDEDICSLVPIPISFAAASSSQDEATIFLRLWVPSSHSFCAKQREKNGGSLVEIYNLLFSPLPCSNIIFSVNNERALKCRKMQ